MSSQVPAGVEASSDDDRSLTEAEVESIRKAEEEQQLKRVNGSEPIELTLDKKFELLKNQRRRRVLRFLMENSEASTTGELAEHVAVLENDKANVNALTSKERKAAYVGLYQCHLPKMDDYGVIEFNQARGRIELTERAYELEPYLSRETKPPWSVWYLGIAGTGGVLYVAAILANFSLAASVVAGGAILAILGLAGAHWWTQRPSDSGPGDQ